MSSASRPLFLLAALVFFLLFLPGCAGPSPAPVQNASNATVSIEDQARIQALQNEMGRTRADYQDALSRYALAVQAGDFGAARVQMNALASLAGNLSAQMRESCSLKGADCPDETASLNATWLCAQRAAGVMEGMRPLYEAGDYAACAQHCPESSSSCLARCNSMLRDLKQSCTQMRLQLPDVRQFCLSGSAGGLTPGLDALEEACRSVQSTSYWRADSPPASNRSVPVSGAGSAVPAPEDLGPAVEGRLEPDPAGGAYRTLACSIEPKPDTIYAGRETHLQLRAYASNGESITYTCDNGEVRSNGRGGLIDTSRVCRFDDAGPTTVWLALDGYVCASAPLDVLPPNEVSPTPSCRIAANTPDMSRNGTSTTYSAVVRLRNQPPNANLTWGCGSERFSRPLADVLSGELLNGSLRVSCIFNEYAAANAPGRVSVNGQDCGRISPEG